MAIQHIPNTLQVETGTAVSASTATNLTTAVRAGNHIVSFYATTTAGTYSWCYAKPGGKDYSPRKYSSVAIFEAANVSALNTAINAGIDTKLPHEILGPVLESTGKVCATIVYIG